MTRDSTRGSGSSESSNFKLEILCLQSFSDVEYMTPLNKSIGESHEFHLIPYLQWSLPMVGLEERSPTGLKSEVLTVLGKSVG